MRIVWAPSVVESHEKGLVYREFGFWNRPLSRLPFIHIYIHFLNIFALCIQCSLCLCICMIVYKTDLLVWFIFWYWRYFESMCRQKKSLTLKRGGLYRRRDWRSWNTMKRRKSKLNSRKKCKYCVKYQWRLSSPCLNISWFTFEKKKWNHICNLYVCNWIFQYHLFKSLYVYIFICSLLKWHSDSLFLFFFSQMSNLLNQARLKVLKARDDLISVRLPI